MFEFVVRVFYKTLHWVFNKPIEEECLLCCHSRTCLKLSCTHQVCRACMIRSGSDHCPYCKKNVSNDMDDETREALVYVQQLNDKIISMDEQMNEIYDELDDYRQRYVILNRMIIRMRHVKNRQEILKSVNFE